MRKIELEVVDNSSIGMTHALIKYYKQCNSVEGNHLIDLEEIAEHIRAYVKAERAVDYEINRCGCVAEEILRKQ